MKAENKIIVIFIGVLTFLFATNTVVSFLLSIDFFKKTTLYNHDGCVRTTSFGSSEDQTRFNNNSVIMTEWSIMKYKPGEDRPGAMYVASGFQHSDNTKDTTEFVEKHLNIEKLPLFGYPEGVDFHPHGIYIHKPDNTLYVVNHAYENGGERIEVFDIITTSQEDESESVDTDNEVPIRLNYKYSITSDWMQKEMNGILNSLVVVEPNKFYVTQYEAHADDRNPSDLSKDLSMLGILFFKRKETFVWFCEYEPSNSSLECRKVAEGFVVANGITHNPDYSKIFVADMIGRSISVFDRDPSTNDLINRIDVKTRTSVDNIKFDPVSGNVYGAGLGNVYASFKNFALYPGQEKDGSTSALVEVSYSPNPPKMKREQQRLKHYDGWILKTPLSTNKLNMATNGIRMNSHYVMGSGIEFPGILVCPVLEDAETSSTLDGESEL